MNKDVLISNLRHIEAMLQTYQHMDPYRMSENINSLEEAIDIIKRIEILRAAKAFPLEWRMPMDKMDEFARNDIVKSFAAFILTNNYYHIHSEASHIPGTRDDTMLYDGTLLVVKPK